MALPSIFYGILILNGRLLGPKGIPKLRQRARDLKIKGKGHEVRHLHSLSFSQVS